MMNDLCSIYRNGHMTANLQSDWSILKGNRQDDVHGWGYCSSLHQKFAHFTEIIDQYMEWMDVWRDNYMVDKV